MKMITQKKSNIIFLIYLLLLLFGLLYTTKAQNEFSLNTSVTAIGSSSSNKSNHRSYYLYGGIRYQAQNYNLSLSLPLVFNSSSSFTQVGGIYMPNGNGEEGVGEGLHGSGNHGSMMDDGIGMSGHDVGFGDLYLYGSYNIFKESGLMPGVSADSFIKFPTASSPLNIGTGDLDINLAISARKFVSTLSFYVQVGYLFLGNADEANIENPLTLSLVIGNSFGKRKHLLLLGYDSYSTIVKGFAAPQQVSLGYTYQISPDLSYMMIGSFGLNNSASDYTISGGLNIGI